MRPTKLLTISALAGLSLISYGRSAYAETVSLTGTVPSSCTLATSPGSLIEDGTPATNLVANTTDRGTVVVTCNESPKNLRLEISNTSVLYNGIAKIRFNGAPGGVFAGINIPGTPTTSPFNVLISGPTKAIGDTGYIQARIDAPGTPGANLLKVAGSPSSNPEYNLVVKATIVP